ncbi:MAG: polysaccharide biosynthesis/export family protein [Mesorhizobium sp.]|nr:polysaccharide biosynthesis/export family protein [Mesorhizobium sp.]
MTRPIRTCFIRRRPFPLSGCASSLLVAALAVSALIASPISSRATDETEGALAMNDAISDPAVDPARFANASPVGQFHIGDRLQINFFEHLELGHPNGNDTGHVAANMRTFYQRLDLTAEYRVEMDGAIAIPLLGRFHVDSKSIEGLREEIATAFERETGRSGEVYVAILERQPIFVIGVVRNAGSYAFSPGMIALQAIALAGGYERPPEGATQHLDARRERERLALATRRLQRLVAHRARLLEQRDGIAVAASHPILLENSLDAGQLFEGERDLVDVEQAVRRGESQSQEAILEGARGELEALKGSLDLVERQIEARAERLRVLQQMQGRGVTNLEAVWAAQKDVTDYELQREQLVSAVHLADQRVSQAELAKAGVDLGHRASLARELVAVDDEIAALEVTIATSEEVARTLDLMASARGIGPFDEIDIQILRRTANGVITIPAAESTELLPSDVVKILIVRDRMIQTSQR